VSAAEGNRDNDVKSSACWIWRPKGNLIDHIFKDSGSYTLKRFDYVDPQGRLESNQRIFDSGCFRHMTGNKSYLTDYQEIDGGFVTFRGNAKGGIENQMDHKVKRIRCDNGTEFKNRIMNEFCEMKGIRREFSIVRTPRNKKYEIGIVVRNKARLVAQGHTQEEGIDYDEVFAPVSMIESIKLFLTYASFMGFIVYQMNVKSAFLYGTIKEE
nr:copia protein [Tanacetum cinerariifolium]